MPWNLRPGIYLLAFVISTSLLGACSAGDRDLSVQSVREAVRHPQTFATGADAPKWRQQLLHKERLSTERAMKKTRVDDYDENYNGIRVIGLQFGCSAAAAKAMAAVHETGWMEVENVPFPHVFREATLPYLPPPASTAHWVAPPHEYFVNDSMVFRLYKISGVIRGDISNAIWGFTCELGKPKEDAPVHRWCKGVTDVTLRRIDAQTAEVTWEYKPLRNLCAEQLALVAGDWEAPSLQPLATACSVDPPDWIRRGDAAMINECPHDYEPHNGIAFSEVPLGASARRMREILSSQGIEWSISSEDNYPGITRELLFAGDESPWPGVSYVPRGKPMATLCMDEGVFRLGLVHACVEGDVEQMLEQARRIYGEPHASIFPYNRNYWWEADDTRLSMTISQPSDGSKPHVASLIYEHCGLLTIAAGKKWQFDENGKGPALASE